MVSGNLFDLQLGEQASPAQVRVGSKEFRARFGFKEANPACVWLCAITLRRQELPPRNVARNSRDPDAKSGGDPVDGPKIAGA